MNMGDEDDSCVPSPTWFEAMTTLIGHGLPVCRVTTNCHNQVTVIWRNPPTDDQKAAADALIGSAQHSW